MSVPATPDRLAIVLTPFARPDVVAAACKQLGMTDAVAVPSRSGVVVTRPLPAKAEHTDWDIAELFGEAPSAPAGPGTSMPDDDAAAPGADPLGGADARRDAPAGRNPLAGTARDARSAGGAADVSAADAGAADAGAADPSNDTGADRGSVDPGDDQSGGTAELTAADAAEVALPEPSENAGEELATAMSTITRRGVVLVLADLGVDTGLESGLAGHLVAREWTAGEPGKEVPPGLLLANADDVVEDIVLGRRAPDEIKGAVRAIDVTGRGPKRRLFGRGD
ncbi:hypothetical protein ACPYO6_01265 [Georgenia sp. Z1344]|uniref:hypothetical protein n=1 Tax=Georgenia sp. Z1344 TaxID=3416706 RepID=UPI003CE78ED3